MPRRVVIHAGFHKTGTSTIQQTLRLNRPVLKPHVRAVLRHGLREVVSAARGYSSDGDDLSRARFHNRFGTFLMHQPILTRRVLCLSAEELSGHLPGRPNVTDYQAAIQLTQDMADAVDFVFPKAELIFFYTTRAPQNWLASAWSEHVKSSSMKMGFAEFAERNAQAAELDAIVDRIAAAAPVRVERASLEETVNTSFGPATPLLDLCEVPQEVRDQMTRPAPANRRPDNKVMAEMLKANRTIEDREALKAVKADILASATGGTA